jgi:hypothetical protein
LSVVFADGDVSTVPTDAPLSPGRGSSVLRRKVGTFKRGPRKGQAKFAVVSVKRATRGKVQGRTARAVGVGADAAAMRAADLSIWLAPLVGGKVDAVKATERARIVAELASERELGGLLQGIGARAAARQVRRLQDLRGVKASATSAQDASADAVAGVLASVRRLDKVSPDRWRGCGADLAARCQCAACARAARFLRVLSLYAGRAAFASLASWAVNGITGDSGKLGGVKVGEFATGLADTLAADDGISDALQDDGSARWRVVRWVYAVGFRRFVADLPADMRGAARASAILGARRRCRVLGSVLFGASLADACLHAGFSSADAFANSARTAGFWRALRDARQAEIGNLPGVSDARGWARAWAIDAGDAWRVLGSLAGDGVRGAVDTGTARALTARARGGLARRMARRAAAREFLQAVAWEYWRKLASTRAARNLRAFDGIADKLKAGKFADLRAATVGKSQGGINPAMIGKARGKVSKRAPLAGVVSVTVATRYGSRAVQCAPAVGQVQPWANDGAGGFAIVNG